MTQAYRATGNNSVIIECKRCGSRQQALKQGLKQFRYICRNCRYTRYRKLEAKPLTNEDIINMCREADKAVYGSDEQCPEN